MVEVKLKDYELRNIIRYLVNKADYHLSQHKCNTHGDEDACKKLDLKGKDLTKSLEEIIKFT